MRRIGAIVFSGILLGASLGKANAEVADAAWQEMVAAEELIHALGPALGGLARSLEHGALPDGKTRSLFAGEVVVRDLAAAGPVRQLGERKLWRFSIPPSESERQQSAAEISLWTRLLADSESLGDASFKVARGRFSDPLRSRFAVDLVFAAKARRRGRIASYSGSVSTEWAQQDSPDGTSGEWRIVSWQSGALEVVESAGPFFEEALDRAVPDPRTRRELRRSRHEELALAKLRDPAKFRNPHRHFFVGSQDRHPGIAVADVDGDSIDDIYVMARWGANQLLLGQADGTFREAAGSFGLAIADHSSAAVFADFDNDGDADLFLGRTMVPSLYLENRGGVFVDRSETALPGGLPSLVSSVNAVDADGDGLLDIYVSTYAAQMLVFDLKIYQAQNPGMVSPPRLLEEFLPPDQAAQLSQHIRTRGAHIYMSLPGPPNVLLLNKGDHFVVSADELIASYRNTYQATWSDYDRDGDADVYLAHDFAPNQLLRNEGGGRFVDVTEATGTADVGFGMGVSWADYDRDGSQDLYVSNMYSKAGRRVTSYFSEVDRRLIKMARGNTLFRNRGDTFEQVSGLDEDSLHVEKAGWSWGGQFVDLDNDAHLDIYVTSGYYSAPREVAIAVDT